MGALSKRDVTITKILQISALSTVVLPTYWLIAIPILPLLAYCVQASICLFPYIQRGYEAIHLHFYKFLAPPIHFPVYWGDTYFLHEQSPLQIPNSRDNIS